MQMMAGCSSDEHVAKKNSDGIDSEESESDRRDGGNDSSNLAIDPDTESTLLVDGDLLDDGVR